MNNYFLKTLSLGLVCFMWSCESDNEAPPSQGPPPVLNDWTEQPSTTFESIKDIQFVDNSFGWAVGENLMLTTANGGSSWEPAPFEPSTQPQQINSLFFVDQQTGWIAGGLAEDEGGEIFITEQGGAYPVLQLASNEPLMAIHFVDENNGWAAGLGGRLVSTIDGGAQWMDIANLGADLYDVHFTTTNKGWAAGDNGSLFKTTDGDNFNLEDLGADQRLTSIHFSDTLYGWVCGFRNTIFKRDRNSENQIVWTDASILEASEVQQWNDIFFLDRLNGWVVGLEGNVWKTTDGGQNWSRETIDTFESLNAIYMASSTKGWIAGDNGLIFTYTP